MAPFDIYVKKIGEYVEEMRSRHRQVREINYPAWGDFTAGLPVRIGTGAQPGVILKEDTFVELGNPRLSSCAFLLWTDNLSLIKDRRIILVGPDIHESTGESLPFGQVLVLGGASLEKEHQTMLEIGQYISDRLEGYMIRSVPQRMWSRVSKEAVEKGFCFETLGRALMGIIKSELPVIEAMEILFVTSSQEDVARLEDIAKQVEKITREIKKGQFVIEEDGYLCTTGLDCGVCLDKNICDGIREILGLRKTGSRSG